MDIRRNRRNAWLWVSVAAVLFLAGCGGGDSGVDVSAESLDPVSLTDGTRGNVSDGGSVPVGGGNSPDLGGEPADKVKVGEKYEFSPVYEDADGDGLQFLINNRPPWANFDNATGRLYGRPAESDIGVYTDIQISVADGQNTVVLKDFNIQVIADGTNLPVISGTPASSVRVREPYSFKPRVTDVEDDVFSFEIAGQPEWANFDIETGRLFGTPESSDVGVYNNITISVTDGTNFVALPPFSITVERASGANQPPAISGLPERQIEVGRFYDFTPRASDPDSGSLTFSIKQAPKWANFNPATGQLSGTPTSADVGTRWGIVITVSDGIDADSIGPFDIRVDEPAVVTNRKYNPGHYITVYRTDTGGNIKDSLKPGVTGLQKRYYWRSLEPSQGNYNFSQLRADLNLVESLGSHLVVIIEDKTFVNDIPAPAYLRDYTFPNITGGYTVKRWDPYVVRRFTALLDALGKEFDKHPALEGIGVQETSLSLDEKILNQEGYTPQRYRDAIIDVLSAAAADFPNSQVFWYQNFLKGRQDYIDQIARIVAPKGVAFGGPDILPDAPDLKNVVYPRYRLYKDQMTLFNSVQNDSYAHLHKDKSYPTKYWTPQELYVFGRDELHLNYIFWTKKRDIDRGDEGSYTWKDALPVIRNNPVINP